MIADIKTAAEAVGVTAFITNSTEKIEVQLNRITSQADLPIMIVAWNLQVNMTFNDNGFLDNPIANVTCLLMNKPEDTTKDEAEKVAEEMYFLYLEFIQKLRDILAPKMLNYQNQPITGLSCGLVPRYGLGKHSGVKGDFSMITSITNC
jgi:hypothetical protein